MAQQLPNGVNKFDSNDYVRLQQFNENWETIDAAIGDLRQADTDAQKTISDVIAPEMEDADSVALTLKHGAQVVNVKRDTPMKLRQVGGRTLVNVLGRAGACESVDSVFSTNPQKTSVALDSTTKVQGSNSIKVTQSEANHGVITRQLKGLASEKPYVFVAYFRSESASLPIHAELWGTAGAIFDRVITNEWAPQFFLLRSHTTYKELYVWAKSAGTFNIDAMRLYEVSAAEYNALATMTPEQVAAKYPYVDGMANVDNPYVETVGGNLCPPLTEWSMNGAATVHSPYSFTLSVTGTRYNGSFAVVPAIPNTTYTLGGKFTGGGKIYADVRGTDGSHTYHLISTDHVTFTTGSNAATIEVLATNDQVTNAVMTFSDFMLVLGKEPKPFKPQQRSMWAAECELAAEPLTGNNADTLVVGDDGKPYVVEKWGKLVLDGSCAWIFAQHIAETACKAVKVPNLGTSSTYNSFVCARYDGGSVSPSGGLTRGDQAYFTVVSGNRDFVITVPNVDSGWGADYTPTADEIKAYFYGYKMTHLDGTKPYTTSGATTHGAKVWIPLAGFNGGNGSPTLPSSPSEIAIANGWTPYRLQYLKATPTVVPVKSYEIGAALSEGGNVVEVGSGIVIREKAKVTALHDYALINHVSYPPTLENRTKRIFALYHNGSVAHAWDNSNRDAYGEDRLYTEIGKYDPTAVYTVTYTKLTPSAPSPSIVFEYEKTLGAVTARTAQDVAELAARVSVMEGTKADKGAAPVQWVTPTLLNGWTASSAAFTPKYRIDEDGVVHLRGGVANGSAAYPVLVLPKGYRPSYFRNFSIPAFTSGDEPITAYANVSAEGYLRIRSTAGVATVSYSLDGVSFLAEQ